MARESGFFQLMIRQPLFNVTASGHPERGGLSPWQIDPDEFPFNGAALDRWKFLLGYAVLAPSSHNTQPWLFHICDTELHLYADRTRACPISDPNGRELVMSCGCALFHLRAAMRHFGCLGAVEILPEPNDIDLLARVRMEESGPAPPENELLFYAIPKRRTNRQPFSADAVPLSLLAALDRAASDEGAAFITIVGEEQRNAVGRLIAEGDRRQWADKRFRLELAAWVHSNRSGVRDGIPGYAQGVDDLLSCAGPLVVRTFNMGEGQAAKDEQLAKGSPVLALINTAGDSARDWMHAGQALARVLLRARIEDVWASFLNQPIELPDLRSRLQSSLGLKDSPQACLRLGFAESIKPTPRREVEDVLI